MNVSEIDKKGKESETGVEESWFEKWVDLIKNLLGAKELEEIAKDFASKTGIDHAKDINKVVEVLHGAEDEEKRGFLNKLVGALLDNNDDEVNNLIKAKFIEQTERDLFDELVEQTKNRKKGNQIVDKDETERYGKVEKIVIERREKSITQIVDASKVKGEGDLAIEIKSIQDQVKEEAKAKKTEPTQAWFEIHIKEREIETQELKRNGKINPNQELIRNKSTEVVKRLTEILYEDGDLPDDLTLEERVALRNFVFVGNKKDLPVKQKLLFRLMNHAKEGSETKRLLAEMIYERPTNPDIDESKLSRLETLIDQESGIGSGTDMTDLLRMMNGGVSDDEAIASNSLRYLNIEPKIYIKMNEELRGKLNISFDALVRDDELKIYRVSSELTSDQKKQLTTLIFDRLAAEVRMIVDEGKDLREKQYEPLLRVYNTLTAIVGLDTAQKSEIKQKLNFEVISFMMFNSFQNDETKKMVAEMASHIGAESNIFTGMLRRKETFIITDASGKEMEIGAFNIYDFAKIAGSKITNPEDRAAYKITKPASEVGRTHASMMYSSNKPEEKLLGRGILTKRVIIDQYGESHYEQLLHDYLNIPNDGEKVPIPLDREREFLDKIGKKYFDYHNGVFVYWGMTNQMADYVGNAYIDNSKLVPPAGIPESLWKNDMKLLYLFHENYHGVKNVDMLLWLRTAFNSMLVKEASEVWSWIINTDENVVTKVETIYTGLFGGKKSTHGVKVQQAFLESMFEEDKITLSEKNHKLHHKTKILESIKTKKKDGLLVVDTMTRRRDWGTFNEKMRETANTWDDAVFEDMDFAFIAEKMKHLPRVSEVLLEGVNDPKLNKQKFFFLIDNMSDEFALFDNLSQKRGDTPMKYNLDYFAKASQAAIALATDITYANAIAFIAEAQKVSGVGKVGDLAMMVLERVREKREAMGWWQSYVIPKIVDGRVKIDSGSYVGDLPGAYPLFELEERSVSAEDIRMHPEGVSIASLSGDPKGVDKEEIHFKYALDRMWQLNILTEEEYKHAVKEFFHEMKGWNNKKNPVAELWAHVSGKKLIEYWAAQLNVPGEVLEKWIFEGGAEFFGLWWKYFNGTGAAHH